MISMSTAAMARQGMVAELHELSSLMQYAKFYKARYAEIGDLEMEYVYHNRLTRLRKRQQKLEKAIREIKAFTWSGNHRNPPQEPTKKETHHDETICITFPQLLRKYGIR